MQRNDVMQIAD